MSVFLYITTEYKQQVNYFVSKKSKNNIIKDLHYFFSNLLLSSLKDKIKVNKQSESHRVLFWAIYILIFSKFEGFLYAIIINLLYRQAI